MPWESVTVSNIANPILLSMVSGHKGRDME
jgi:hypothetical protein